MPKRYKRKCINCGIDYKGFGSKFCTRKCNIIFRHKIGNFCKWKPTLEQRKKISENTKKLWERGILKPHSCSESVRKKMSIIRLGKKMSDETREKMRKIGKDSVLNGKCPLWKGGITKNRNLIKSSLNYKLWRELVFKRDNWICQKCKQPKKYIHAHHIKSFSEIINKNNIKSVDDAIKCEELWDINNGLTLCKDCHRLTDNYAKWGKNK